MKEKIRIYKDVSWAELLKTNGKLFILTLCIIGPFLILEQLGIIPEHFKNTKFERIYENGIIAGLLASGTTFFILLYQIGVKILFSDKVYDSPNDSDE